MTPFSGLSLIMHLLILLLSKLRGGDRVFYRQRSPSILFALITAVVTLSVIGFGLFVSAQEIIKDKTDYGAAFKNLFDGASKPQIKK